MRRLSACRSSGRVWHSSWSRVPFRHHSIARAARVWRDGAAFRTLYRCRAACAKSRKPRISKQGNDKRERGDDGAQHNGRGSDVSSSSVGSSKAREASVRLKKRNGLQRCHVRRRRCNVGGGRCICVDLGCHGKRRASIQSRDYSRRQTHGSAAQQRCSRLGHTRKQEKESKNARATHAPCRDIHSCKTACIAVYNRSRDEQHDGNKHDAD